MCLHGKGWMELDTFSRLAAGAVTSREQLVAAVDAATVLIDTRPVDGIHPMYAMGRAVIRPRPQGDRKFVDLVRQALVAAPSPFVSKDPLSFEQIRRLL